MTDEPTIADVTDLGPIRLANLDPLNETFFDQALPAFRATLVEHGETADAFRRYTWNKTTASGMGEPFEVDEILERNGQAAVETCEAAFQEMHTAQLALTEEIARMVSATEFVEGDVIRSPYGEWPMTVAMIFRAPDASLSEVTFTTDGGPIVKELHSWEIVDGRAQIDGTEPVHYERWSINGVRVRGTCHRISRQLIDVE